MDQRVLRDALQRARRWGGGGKVIIKGVEIAVVERVRMKHSRYDEFTMTFVYLTEEGRRLVSIPWGDA